jgi:putative methyltransferase (TIGR04325 family)
MKTFLRRLTPPLLWDALRRARQAPHAQPGIEFTGDYPNWEAARADSTGYGEAAILVQTAKAMRAVRDGHASFERDGVLLPEPELPLPLLAGLLRAAAENEGVLDLVDFGGALGSTYYATRRFLRPLRAVRWRVVDLPATTACGRAEFATDELSFHDSLDEAGPAPVLVLSGSLQFLPDPHGFLQGALARRFETVALDRTFICGGDQDRLTVQHVPAWIYPARYPAWFFSEPRLLAHFESGWDRLASFPAIDEPTLPDAYAAARGYLFRRRALPD